MAQLWSWPVTAPQGRDLRRSLTMATMSMGCTAVPSTGASSGWWPDFALCIAGCAAVPGRGYYLTGLVSDVPGRPRRVKPSFHVLRPRRNASGSRECSMSERRKTQAALYHSRGFAR